MLSCKRVVKFFGLITLSRLRLLATRYLLLNPAFISPPLCGLILSLIVLPIPSCSFPVCYLGGGVAGCWYDEDEFYFVSGKCWSIISG